MATATPTSANTKRTAAPKRRTASASTRATTAKTASARGGSSAGRTAKPASRRAASSARAGTTGAKATAAKGARTRAVHSGERTLHQSRIAARSTADVVGDYAERAVLIPVGAALIARDRVVSGVNDVISSYSTPSRAQIQLSRFERRGSTARNRLEREVRKTRTRVERELRHSRREIERRVTMLDRRSSDAAQEISTQVDKVVQDRVQEGSDLVSRLQERVLTLI